MPTYIDSVQRNISIPANPQRIISLCPSITELLFHLKLEDQIVGRTRFCIHPKEQVKQVPHVGGTKQLKMERLHPLQPDLIIAEKEENTPEMIAELEQHYPVYVTDIVDVDSALDMIEVVGKLTNRNKQAQQLIQQIQYEFQQIPKLPQALSCLYFIWKKPWMIVGTNTYIDSVLSLCGIENIGKDLAGRYPHIQTNDIQAIQPELILLSSEPYPFQQEHIEELRKLCPQADIRLLDGEMFSWYGSRMLEAGKYLTNFVHSIKARQSSTNTH